MLARYIVARYGGNHVLWDLDRRGQLPWRGRGLLAAGGRAVFPTPPYPLVTLHPYGMDWALDEFNGEPWMTVMGYQSAHGDNEEFLRWITEGPPSTRLAPPATRAPTSIWSRPMRATSPTTRAPRSTTSPCGAPRYWSVLVSPPAGVCYGAHGVWSWSEGKEAPMAHKDTGTPLPWREALEMPGAAHMTVLVELMDTLPWWRLRPAPDLLATQPGQSDARRTIVAARSEDGATALVYAPMEQSIELCLSGLRSPLHGTWVNPRTGARHDAGAVPDAETWRLDTPGDGDWVLVLES